MPIYISRGKFTTDAVKGMLAKPENREEAVSATTTSIGRLNSLTGLSLALPIFGAFMASSWDLKGDAKTLAPGQLQTAPGGAKTIAPGDGQRKK